jgi:hypothetical protein
MAEYLFASLFWGTIGFGIFLYGKKIQALIPMLGGVAMIGVSYFTGPLVMSLVSILIIGAIFQLKKMGY